MITTPKLALHVANLRYTGAAEAVADTYTGSHADVGHEDTTGRGRSGD